VPFKEVNVERDPDAPGTAIHETGIRVRSLSPVPMVVIF
jgi:hypothetical protein